MNTITKCAKHALFICVLVTPLLYTVESMAKNPFRRQAQSGAVVSDEQKATIKKGKTTRVQVLQELGNPSQEIDLGKGKVQFSYVQATTTWGLFSSIKHPFGRDPSDVMKYTEFWIIFKNNVVEDFGEKPTNKRPQYFR